MVCRRFTTRSSSGRNVDARWSAGEKCRALTLVEAVAASIILSVTVVAVAQAIMAGHMQTAEALHRRRAMEMAEALTEEVLRLPYDDPDGASNPGPESGETSRASFDNIDDYHGFTESAGNVSDLAGTVYPIAYDRFARSVSVVADSQTVTGFGSAFDGQTVTVTVTDDTGTAWSVSVFVPAPAS